jgi:hypothetical protein
VTTAITDRDRKPTGSGAALCTPGPSSFCGINTPETSDYGTDGLLIAPKNGQIE